MNKFISSLIYICIIIGVTGCAKTAATGPNDSDKRYLEAWMQLNWPGIDPSGLGIYILDDNPGTGKEVSSDGYALVDYRISTLEGEVTSYTDAEMARQLGTYSETTYYGPEFLTTFPTTIQAGLADGLVGTKVGTSRKILIPGWLMTYKQYDTAEDYLNPPKKDKNETTTSYMSPAIYEFTIRDYTEDMPKWEIDSIGRFFRNTSVLIGDKPSSEIFKGMTAADSVSYGFYYKQLKAPENTEEFEKDTTLYINYTGKLLNGKVFDTTIEKIAIDNGLHSDSRTYEPMRINWGEEYSDITMGSDKSTPIIGFAKTLWQMKSHEKGVGVFYSNIGYSHNGSGSGIPSYAPLIFEIEFVDKPEE